VPSTTLPPSSTGVATLLKPATPDGTRRDKPSAVYWISSNEMTVQPTQVSSGAELIDALGPAEPQGRALILIGGADLMPEGERIQVETLFRQLVTHVDRTHTAVVDGGTNSGVMRLIGELREEIGGTFRLVGVVPAGALERTTSDGQPIMLASGHPEIILVPGSKFGDETDWLFAAADHLAAGDAPTLVVNGGQLTLEEAHQRLTAGKRVVAVEGSGRAADELASDEGLRLSGRLHVIPLTADPAVLAGALEEEA
jgi:SLOG in TRPM, prokaryote